LKTNSIASALFRLSALRNYDRWNFAGYADELQHTVSRIPETKSSIFSQTGGVIYAHFYECPEGIEQQAHVIVNDVIPQALREFDGLVYGQVAVLYSDRNDGSIIANAVETAGIPYVRIDSGAAYRRTPVTRWLEDCASWCAGGWANREPPLSDVMRRWLLFNSSRRTDADRVQLRETLVRFLFAHRKASIPLHDWLERFLADCLSRTLETETRMRDEKEAVQGLLTATSQNGTMAAFDIGTFSGQGGSPEHLNLITLHSAKGLEFEVVIMMGMDNGRVPRWDASSKEAVSEARRLFYVGLTRAKRRVAMTYSGFTVDRLGRHHINGPSPFLVEVRAKLSPGNLPVKSSQHQ
jgi:DNA helicase II / ATP-dependent DNA helicase PcrA